MVDFLRNTCKVAIPSALNEGNILNPHSPAVYGPPGNSEIVISPHSLGKHCCCFGNKVPNLPFAWPSSRTTNSIGLRSSDATDQGPFSPWRGALRWWTTGAVLACYPILRIYFGNTSGSHYSSSQGFLQDTLVRTRESTGKSLITCYWITKGLVTAESHYLRQAWGAVGRGLLPEGRAAAAEGAPSRDWSLAADEHHGHCQCRALARATDRNKNILTFFSFSYSSCSCVSLPQWPNLIGSQRVRKPRNCSLDLSACRAQSREQREKRRGRRHLARITRLFFLESRRRWIRMNGVTV